MRWITTTDDFNEMLRCDEALLYIYVDWSVYSARDGLQIVEQVERFLHERHPERRLSIWAADTSDLASPAAFICDWLKEQEKGPKQIRMFPAIAIGAGSLVWISEGEVIDFAFSALHLGVEGIIQISEAAFSPG